MFRLALVVPLAALVLAGCAGPNSSSARAPSLLPRAIETRSDGEPGGASAIVMPDAALDSAIAALDGRLADSASGFAAEQIRAAPVVGRAAGADAGSDAWLAAQSAVAVVAHYKAQTQLTVTDAEQLAIARAQNKRPAYPALEALVDRAMAQAEAQDQALTRLVQALAHAA